jgi:hypothetical protein
MRRTIDVRFMVTRVLTEIRCHEEIVTTPTHARHALSYVLNNWRRHKEDRVPATKRWVVDPYSTARSFIGWIERVQLVERGDEHRWIAGALSSLPDDLEALPTGTPQSWLLREGWKLGGDLSALEQPGPRVVRAAA